MTDIFTLAFYAVLKVTRSCYQLILGPYLTAWCVSLQSVSGDNLKHRQLVQIHRYRDVVRQ